MNVEVDHDLQRRVAVHAALADPARLSIVDALSVGDASPSELAAMLDMPSNLIAHHLNALTQAGLIIRSRSEGDGRRSYVKLQPGALASSSERRVRASRVLFVCTANSARSQLAAALWRRASGVPSVSAGTHPASQMHPGAIAVARRHDLPMRRIRPRLVDEVHADHDLVITVCDSAHEELAVAADLHWSVPDPVRAGTDAAFDHAFNELSRRVGDLSERLENIREM